MAYGNYAPFYRGGFFNPMQTPQMPNMAENQNQFAQPYQAPIQQPMAMPTPNNDMIFVLGQNEAESFPVAPNATVTMWDKNQKTFYVKTANAQGIPSMQIYDFEERVATAPQTPEEHVCKCGENFATKEQLTDLQAKFDNMAAIVNELKAKPVKRSTKEDE